MPVSLLSAFPPRLPEQPISCPVLNVNETHTTFAGDCPAGLKPGQLRKANGEVVDPMAGLAKIGAGAKAK